MNGTTGLSSYSYAKTVAKAKATVECHEGKELVIFLSFGLFRLFAKGPMNRGEAASSGA